MMFKILISFLFFGSFLFAGNSFPEMQDTQENAPGIINFSPVSAASGTTITINGNFFTGATAVSFGGVAASSFNVVSATQITAVVGTGASGAISVTTPSGTTTLNGFVFLAPSTQAHLAGTISTRYLQHNVASIVDSNLTITADGLIDGMKVQITGTYTSGDVLSYTGSLPSGITANFTTNNGILSFSGVATPAVWQELMRRVTFKSTNATCYTQDREITFVIGNKYYNSVTGHFYESVSSTQSWVNAKNLSENRAFYGYLGYLATTTTQGENNFIWKIMAADCWVGASDDYQQINAAVGYSKYANQSASEGRYYWVTGPEAGTPISIGNSSPVAVNGAWANWNPGEPNNSGSEHYTQFYSGQQGRWNDLGSSHTQNTYLVEYGGQASDDESNQLIASRVIEIAGSSSGYISGGNVNVCPNTNATTLTIEGLTGTVVRWEYSYDNFYTAGVAINHTGTSYTPTNLTQSTYYRAIVNSTSPSSCNGLSTASTAVIVENTVGGFATASNTTICSGGDVNLTLSGNVGDVQKWQRSSDNSVWTDIANTTTFLTETVNTVGTMYYRAVVQTAGCGNPENSSTVTITVQNGTPPVGGSVSTDTYNGGSHSGTLNLTGESGTVAKWQYSDNNGTLWTDVNNTTTSINYTNISATRLYRAQVIQGSCGSTFSDTGMVKIYLNQNIMLADDSLNIIYSDSKTAIGATSSNTTINITYSSDDSNIASIIGDSIIPQNVGTTYIRVNQAGNNTFAAATEAVLKIVVSPRPLTIAAHANQSKIYGSSEPIFTYLLTSGNLVNGDTYSGALSRVAGENVGTYAIEQGTFSAGNNYNISFVSSDFEIFAKPITITAQSKTKVYGENDPALTYSVPNGSLVGSDALSGDLQRIAGENVGKYEIQQGSLSAGNNYNITYLKDSLEITLRAIAITADPLQKTYLDNDPSLTYQITSGSLAFSDQVSGSLLRDVGENVGKYAIEQGSVAINNNYNLTYAKDSLTINARAISFTLDQMTIDCDVANKSISVTPSIDTAQYHITYDGNTQIPDAVGQYNVNVQPVNNNFTGDAQGTLIIQDTVAPVFENAQLIDLVVNCSLTELTSPVANDNCGSVNMVNNAQLPLDTNGTYTVTWTATDEHGNASQISQNIIVQGNEELIISQQDNIMYSNIQNGTNYQWIDCERNSFLLNSNQASYEPNASILTGEYSLTVTNNKGCNSTSECFFFVREAEEESGMEDYNINIHIYPNPTQDMIYFESDGIDPNFEVEIQDLNGKSIGRYSAKEALNGISLKSLTDAIYLIKIMSNEHIKTYRIMKQGK